MTIKGPARPGLEGISDMQQKYVVVTFGEVMAALLALGIMTFLLLM
jgi:hypothetical protein